ncbi:MAG: hypothetical protein IJ304_00805 [Clostridia bacterium]|nr:hypothetical protein [Clostridia bacterium]
MKKRILLVLMVAVICTIFMGMVSVSATARTTITIGDEEINEENEITVPVTISNNVGLTGLTLSVEYDSDILTLTGITRGEALTTLILTKPGDLSANPVNIVWDGTEADNSNGSMILLEFVVTGNIISVDNLIDVTVVTACDEDLNYIETVVNQSSLQLNEYEVNSLPRDYLEYINESGNEIDNNDIEISVNFMYDDVYTEKALNRGKTIQAQVSARSTGLWTQAMSVYVALYDENNKLISVANTNSNIASDGNYQFIDVDLPLEQDLAEGYTIRTFVWESQTMKPYLAHETIVSTDDYHADSIQNARYVDMSKLINGVINTDTDKDCVKFIPGTTQNYFIQSFGGEQLEISLYSSDGTKITTNNSYTENIGTIIEQNLTEGELYYIEISGSTQSEYTIAITPNMIVGIIDCSFDVTQGDFCTIPIAISNANSLENISFSIHYSDTIFELYDACDMTNALENTPMQISYKLIDIVDVQPSYIVFKSLKTSLSNIEIINIVKLKAKRSTSSTVSVRAYKIQ